MEAQESRLRGFDVNIAGAVFDSQGEKLIEQFNCAHWNIGDGGSGSAGFTVEIYRSPRQDNGINACKTVVSNL